MSTLVLEDVGASTPGEPLRLRFDTSGDTEVEFRVNDDGDLYIETTGPAANIGVRLPRTTNLYLEGNATSIAGVLRIGYSPGVFSSSYKVSVQEQDITVAHVMQLEHLSDGVSAQSPRGLEIDYAVMNSNQVAGLSKAYLFFHDNDFLGSNKGMWDSIGGIHNYQSNDVDLCDERLKDIDGPLGDMWTVGKALELIAYRHKNKPVDSDAGRLTMGLTAQQVGQVAPGCMYVERETRVPGKRPGDPDEMVQEMNGVYSKDIAYIFYKCVQECMDRIEALEAP